MYCAVLFLGISNSSSVQPVVEVERTVFYREKAAGMYSAIPHAFGQVTGLVDSRIPLQHGLNFEKNNIHLMLLSWFHSCRW
jgi:hypothetical protein